MNKLILISLFLFYSTYHFCQVPFYLPNEGLLAWWPFNGDALDESENVNNGIIQGASFTEDRFGESEKALLFDGINDHITIRNASGLSPEQSLTVSAWILIDSSCVDNANILTRSNDIPPNYGSYQLMIGDASSDSLGRFSIGLRTQDVNDPQPSNGTFVKTKFWGTDILGQWQNVVSTWDGQFIRNYQNGILISQKPHDGKIFYDDGEFLIGSGRTGSIAPGRDVFFKGKIDDVAIWDRALSEEEVLNVFNGPPCYRYISVTDTLYIRTDITSLDPLGYWNTMKVYPNPARDYLIIDAGDLQKVTGYMINVINNTGSVVAEISIRDQIHELSLDLWGMKGLYFFQFYNDQGELIDVKKIVLE